MMGEKDRFTDYLAEIPNFLSAFIYSIFFNLASPILIEISKSTGILTTNLGFIFTFFTIGAALGQLTSVFYNRRFKKIQVIIAGYIVLIPLTVIIGFSNNKYLFWGLYLLSGYIFGVIWMQANQFILVSKVRNKERIITIFLTFYPIGAFIAPFISSSIISAGFSWRLVYYIVIFMISINIILYILLLRRKNESAAIQDEAKLPLREVFTDKTKNLIFILLFLAICFYSSSEAIIATWTPTFLGLARNLPVQPASFSLNLFWLFVIIGRFIILTISGKIKSTKIMLVISTLAIISMLVFTFIYNKYLIFILISIAGLGYSAMFPMLISAGSTLYEKGRGLLATFLFLASNIGLALAPAVIKFSSKVSMQLSISFSFILMAVVTIIVLLIAYLFNRKTGNFTNQEPVI
jgi:FHS family glucose/mannose:H+ symporter-like MFS transporter